MSMQTMVANLGAESEELRQERDEFMKAKSDKAKAENAVLDAIVEAVRPALPVIGTKLEGFSGPLRRAIDLGAGIFLGEEGDFFTFGANRSIRCFSTAEVLDRTSLSAILAVLLAALRAQAGRLDPRTDQIRRETAILEGIAAAFKVGGVR